jgi:ATP-dependent Lon protease
VVRNYLDWLIAVPWKKKTKDRLDVELAEKILNEDHYGLKNPKDRILNFWRCASWSSRARARSFCLVGPPGVGKTSLGRSIARALNRKFIRMSLGGVRDEAEIRGHRRTYIGALPGRIIQNIRKYGSRNPVFLLDEVDKMSVDFRGDPSAALLEVLDPEQNNNFVDHYLEVEYDLSEVSLSRPPTCWTPIPPALRDRMEIIEIPSYTEPEKFQIAQTFLVPKQMKQHGLKKANAVFYPRGHPRDDPQLHARGGGAQPGAGNRDYSTQSGPPGGNGKGKKAGNPSTGGGQRVARDSEIPPHGIRERRRPASRRAWPGPRSEARCFAPKRP